MPVDVDVAGLDAVEPRGDFLAVEGVDAGGEAEAGGVLPLNRLVQVLGVHDAQHRAEALVLVVPGARLHTVADAGGPELALVVELARLQQPFLARLQRGQAALELLARGFDQPVHGGGQVSAWAHHQGGGCVE